MKIFVCCEGDTDIGPLTCFMRKCASSMQLDVHCETHSSLRHKKLISKKYKKLLNELGDNFNRIMYIKKLLIQAILNESKHIAYHQDAGHQGFRIVYNGINEDFEKGIPSEITDMKCLAIVPKEMTESWLLADERTYPTVPTSPKLPTNPEDLWGDKHDSKSNYPYNYFKRVLIQFRLEDNRDTYAAIAKNIDIEVLKRRCPESFGQFYTDMQSFIAKEITP